MEILENNWVVGIVSGLIASILFNILLYFIRGKNTKERKRRIEAANKELVQAVMPMETGEAMLSYKDINGLRWAISKKYKVRPKDLLNNNELINEIKAEIMRNSFLKKEEKLEIVSSLNRIVSSYPTNWILRERTAYYLDATLEVDYPDSWIKWSALKILVFEIATLTMISTISVLQDNKDPDWDWLSTAILFMIGFTIPFITKSFLITIINVIWIMRSKKK